MESGIWLRTTLPSSGPLKMLRELMCFSSRFKVKPEIYVKRHADMPKSGPVDKNCPSALNIGPQDLCRAYCCDKFQSAHLICNLLGTNVGVTWLQVSQSSHILDTFLRSLCMKIMVRALF
jgi:hypothetical protein